MHAWVECRKPAISLKRCKIGPSRLLWRTNSNYRKSYITRFWLVPKSMTLEGLDDLERPIRNLAENMHFKEPTRNKSCAITKRTAQCRCKFRYVSKFSAASPGFSLPQHGFLAYAYISDRSNAEITESTLIFTAVTRNHDDSRNSQHTTGKSHDDRYYQRYR